MCCCCSCCGDVYVCLWLDVVVGCLYYLLIDVCYCGLKFVFDVCLLLVVIAVCALIAACCLLFVDCCLLSIIVRCLWSTLLVVRSCVLCVG